MAGQPAEHYVQQVNEQLNAEGRGSETVRLVQSQIVRFLDENRDQLTPYLYEESTPEPTSTTALLA